MGPEFMPVSIKGVDKKYSIYMLYFMPTDKLKQLEKAILKIKKELLELAPMRPGSLRCNIRRRRKERSLLSAQLHAQDAQPDSVCAVGMGR